MSQTMHHIEQDSTEVARQTITFWNKNPEEKDIYLPLNLLVHINSHLLQIRQHTAQIIKQVILGVSL